MQHRPLGNSGISVTPLAFGGNVFGWSADAATSTRLLDRCVDLGINLIDTADMYSDWVPGHVGGESESIIGDWLKKSGKRDQVIIATKVAKLTTRRGLSPANINSAADDSLRRLGIERIDLYLAHEDDDSVPMEDTLGAFSRLIEQGKVRAIGASNFSAARLAQALAVSAKHNLPRYETLQPGYNLMERADYEAELEPLIRKENIGVISYFSLAKGFLTGKYRSDADLIKSKARGGGVKGYLNPRGMGVLGELDRIAEHHTATPAQVSLAWLMARPGVTAPIASATSIEQLDDIAGALNLHLSASDIVDLDQASAD